METIIFDQPNEVRKRLRELSLNPDGLLEAIDTMVAAHRNITPNDILGVGGSRAYQDGTCRVRDVSGDFGWIPAREGNLESMIHKDKRLRVVVCNSNPGAGLANMAASNRNPKGPATEHIVAENLVQAELEGLLNELENVVPFKDAPRPDGFATWYLFVWTDDDTYRAELSWPVNVEGGHLKNFIERIILVRDGDNDNNLRQRKVALDTDSALEITVTRKQA